MIPKLLRLSLLLLFFQALLPTGVVLADTGPKPTMDFEFRQESTGEPITITSGVLYECGQPDCSDAAPLMEAGPQRFTCAPNHCHALAYGFHPYHRLEIQFSDGKTRQSNIFKTAGFNSKYIVTVRPDDLLVEAPFSLNILPRVATILILCLCALVALALPIGLIIFLVRRRRK